MHVNPDELAGIAALAPITTNPYTGLPEAFSFSDIFNKETLIPLLASAAGTAIGGPLGGAIGSGLATTAVTGDLKRGVMSGLMGYGMGKAFGAAGEAAAKEAAVATGTKAAEEAALNAGANAAMGTGGIQSMSTIANQAAPLMEGAGKLSFGQKMAAPFTQPQAFAKQLASKSSLYPIGVGGGKYMEWDQLDALARNSEAARQKAEAKKRASRERLNAVYGARGFKAGGKTDTAPGINYPPADQLPPWATWYPALHY
jgi:hypothetical protein